MVEKRSYAKIIGENWVYYMRKPCITFGRGPASVDVVLSGDLSISRKAFQIAFSPDLQAFEVSVTGKNGIFVNGNFLRKGDRPVPLFSHSDIILGKSKPATVVFYLPSGDAAVDKESSMETKRPLSMFNMVGHILVTSDKDHMTADEIYQRLVSTRVRLVETLGSKQVIESSIRHAIVSNSHVFQTHSTYDILAAAEQCGEKNIPAPSQAAFSVKTEHKLRFLKIDLQEHQTQNASAVVPSEEDAMDVAP